MKNIHLKPYLLFVVTERGTAQHSGYELQTTETLSLLFTLYSLLFTLSPIGRIYLDES